MMAQHMELLVEEPSMEAFLRALLPRMMPQGRSFEIHAFQGKSDVLGKLQNRLRGYAQWLPEEWRIVVVVDRNDDDCQALKQQLESLALGAGLRTRSRPGRHSWQLVNRIAIEELEAWYFGDWAAVCLAYPRVVASDSGEEGVSRFGCDPWRHVGNVRAHCKTPRLLQDRAAQGGNGPERGRSCRPEP